MNYLFFAFGAAVCFAIGHILNKFSSKHAIDNKDSMMAYFMVSSFFFGLVLLPFVPMTFPSLEVMRLLGIVTSAFLLGYYAFFTGVIDMDASSFAPLFQIQSGMIGLFAFFFLGERFPIVNYLWIGLLIFGAILVSIDETMKLQSFCTRGVALILLMQVFHAISNLSVGFTLKLVSPIQIVFWEEMLIGVAALIFIVLKKPRMGEKPIRILPLFGSSFISGLGAVFLFQAFTENLTVASAIGLLSAPIVFVMSLVASRFWPVMLEHHTAKVYVIRGIGLLVILLGAYRIAVG